MASTRRVKVRVLPRKCERFRQTLESSPQFFLVFTFRKERWLPLATPTVYLEIEFLFISVENRFKLCSLALNFRMHFYFPSY